MRRPPIPTHTVSKPTLQSVCVCSCGCSAHQMCLKTFFFKQNKNKCEKPQTSVCSLCVCLMVCVAMFAFHGMCCCYQLIWKSAHVSSVFSKEWAEETCSLSFLTLCACVCVCRLTTLTCRSSSPPQVVLWVPVNGSSDVLPLCESTMQKNKNSLTTSYRELERLLQSVRSNVWMLSVTSWSTFSTSLWFLYLTFYHKGKNK